MKLGFFWYHFQLGFCESGTHWFNPRLPVRANMKVLYLGESPPVSFSCNHLSKSPLTSLDSTRSRFLFAQRKTVRTDDNNTILKDKPISAKGYQQETKSNHHSENTNTSCFSVRFGTHFRGTGIATRAERGETLVIGLRLRDALLKPVCFCCCFLSREYKGRSLILRVLP